MGGSQGKGGDLLKSGGAEQAAKTTFRLLHRRQLTWLQWIGEVGLKTIETHEPGHFFDQIHLTNQITAAGRRHRDRPSLIG